MGELVVNGAKKAQKDIEDTGKSAEKATGFFEKVGSAIKGTFKDEKVEAFGVSLERLNSRISGQHKKLELLKNKYTDLYLTQGETSEEAQEVAAEIKKLSAELNKNEKALKDAKDAADGFDETLEEVGKEAEEAGKSLKDKWSDSLKEFKNSHPVFTKVSVGVAAVGSAVVAAGKAMIEITENTREYRLEMGKLETAFTTAGHTTEEATETYRTLYSVLGETDRSVEASQHLAELCSSEEELRDMTNACIGAFALFDDSLPIEGLTEAANETAKTGTLTGVLADALNWAGASEEEFQKKLNECNTERERTSLIIETMTALYGEAAEAYKKNNEEVIAATAAQEELNAATARWGEIVEPAVTLFKEGLAAAINFAADAFEDMINPTEAAADALVGTLETVEEAEAKVEELRAKIAEINEIPEEFRPADFEQKLEVVELALADAEAQCEKLAEAERLAAEEASGLAEATAESATKFSEITNQYVEDAMTLFETFTQTYENIYSSVSGWFDPFEEAKTSVETNVNDMMSAMQSQVNFNETYNANLQKLIDYGLGGLSDAFQSCGEDGAAYAQAIVDAVEKAGGATTEEGQQIIQGFSDISQEVTESQQGLSETMALMDGEFESQLQDMIETYDAAIEDLDKSAEASTAATSTFEAFLNGMNTKLPEIESQMKSFGEKITSSIQSGISDVSLTVDVQINGSIPGAKCGMDYVPYDDYLVYLHKGEAVLTAEEAAAWRAGKEVASSGSTGDSGSGGCVTVNQYIEAVPQTPVELASATAAYFEQARWIT